ncbi:MULTISPECIES: N-(5'-phosphoribosyl)anthranilate isomerase [unclassified Streptomyces]|uniref:phosphoribosylanthranilate isomerase n=1 Tax=unclassified Streptomyces TaxID=2593676 RepID=UPI000CD54B52|nr:MULTISPECIES: N-(5'-phosphoribosyl)anthranilate isomerase [unclassified Streptomyces]
MTGGERVPPAAPRVPQVGTAPAPLLKVCGATTEAEVRAARAGGADLLGLWHGVPGGRSDLTAERLTALAAATREGDGPVPVLVTFAHDAEAIAETALAAGVRWLQLHAFQPPSTVAALRAELPDAMIVKAVHLQDGRCLERPLLSAYAHTGTDLFLVDTTTADGRVGSTGVSAPPEAVRALLPALERPFLLAGGVRADARGRYAEVTGHPGYRGVDVDSAARGPDGLLDRDAVARLVHAWTAPAPLPGAVPPPEGTTP